MISEAYLAGLWSVIGNVFGTSTNTLSIVGDNYLLWLCILAVMVLFNTLVVWLFMRLQYVSPSTVRSSVMSSAGAYVLSGLILSPEITSWWWCISALTITVGLDYHIRKIS